MVERIKRTCMNIQNVITFYIFMPVYFPKFLTFNKLLSVIMERKNWRTRAVTKILIKKMLLPPGFRHD